MGLVQFENVSKRYVVRGKRDLLARKIASRFREEQKEFWALRDVSLSIGAGESLALIGQNGAGKSTLLGIVAGVTSPTSGRVTRRGRVSALLELGTGFHPDLTGRENIRLNASLLGLSSRQLARKMESIVEFAELAEFIDQPIRTFSSGMAARLAFSVAIHVEPEILVLDEVMAVGDASFTQKGAREIERLARSGVTLLFVSHALGAVQALCERTIWLDHGRVRMDGPSAEVIEQYTTAMAAAPPLSAVAGD